MTVEVVGERGDGGGVEECADVDFEVEGGADAADQAGGEQGVAAEVEEGVVDADAVQAQEFGEEAAESLFAFGAGRPVGGESGEVGGGQCPAVEFPVGGEGQCGEGDDGGGDHVVGQGGGGGGAQGGRVEVVAGCGDGVGDQAFVARLVLAQDGGGAGDFGVAGQGGFDLAEFDPESADLDLVVGAGQELQLAVGTPCDQVAGTVHAFPRGLGEGAGDEAFGGQCGPPGIAAGQTRPGDIQLPAHTRRHQPQIRTEHVHPRIRNRPPDRDSGTCRSRWLRRNPGPGPALEARIGRPDRRLCRPVQIDDLAPRAPQGRQQVLRERLAADQYTQLAQDVRRSFEEHAPVGGRRLKESRREAADRGCQRSRVVRDLGVHDAEARTAGQGQEHLQDRDVEADRRDREKSVPLVARDDPAHRREEVAQRLVGDRDALGRARGARGVDDVCRVGGEQRPTPVGVGEIADVLPGEGGAYGVVVEHDP
ncbi:hypothetical protein RKD29_006612 [Streptomyces tendae]